MNKITVTHKVLDVDKWIGFHGERVLLFSNVATDLVSYVDDGGSNSVAVSMTVTDPEGFQALIESGEVTETKERHGVLPPITFYTAVS